MSARATKPGLKGRRVSNAAQEPVPMMPAADVRMAYRIMEATCPFPVDAAARGAPRSWAIAKALARATSLHPACVYVHLLIMISLVLNALVRALKRNPDRWKHRPLVGET